MRRLELFLDAKAANTPPRGISKASRVIFSVLTLLFLSIGQVWGGYIDMTTASLSLSGTTYVTKNVSVGGVTIQLSDINSNSGVNFKGATSSAIWNSTEMPANIDSIVFSDVAYSSTSPSNIIVYGASSVKGTTTKLYDNNGTGKIKIDFTDHQYKYFYITRGGTNRTAHASSIKVYYNTSVDVKLIRNGVESTVSKVSPGTTLDAIDGEGAQGGCSAWEFVGWSKAQRAAQDNTTAMTLVTTVDDAGPYYAVYKHSAGSVTDDSRTINIASLATANSWTSGTRYTPIVVDPVSISSNTNGDNGKYYSNDNSWRLYSSTNPAGTVTISVEGGTITSISSTPSKTFSISGNTATHTVTSNTKFTQFIVNYSISPYYYSTTASCCSTLDPIYGSVSAVQPEGCDKKKVEWTIPVDGSSEKKAAGVILKLYADDNNAKGSEITAKAADYSSDNTTTTHTFEGLEPSTKYWFTVTLIGTTASGVTYCNSEEGTAVSFETAAASNSWTITYNANGEGVTNMPTETYADKTSGEGTLSSTVPVRAGYTFLGWDKVDDAESATYAAGGAITGVDDDTDLYAIWEQRTVTLVAGSGTVSGSPLTPNAQGKVTLPSATPSAACAEIGWEFVGWAETEATGIKPATIIPVGEYTPDAKKTLYAVYGELGNTYTKITNAADFTSGNYVFAIAAGQALNNELNSDNKAAGKNVSITSGTTISTTSSDADIIWQVTKSSDNYTLYNAAITKYLNIVPNTSDNYGHLELEADSRNYTVDMSNGDVRLWAPGKSSNQVIEYYSAFTCYGSVNNSALIYAFKQEYDSYATSPNCTAYTLGKAVDPADKGNVALGKTSLLPGAQTTAEATPIDGYRFLNWTITGTGATMSNTSEGKSTDNPVTVTMGSENATITAHFEEIPSHDVKFSVNGSVVDGLTLAGQLEGTAIVFPDAAAITAASAFPETDKTFIGWTNDANKNYSHATDAPTLITSATATADVTYYAVFADVVAEGAYEKLTSTTGLKAGDKIVVTNEANNKGMQAYSSGNNCAVAPISITNNQITSFGNNDDGFAVKLTLGGEADAWTLFDGAYYLYAASSSANQLKGKATKDDACEWTITIAGGTTSVKCNKSGVRPYMRYNSSSDIFSCYANSTDQSAITLYKKGPDVCADYVTTIAPLDHIAITTAPKAAYKKGEALDLSGMVVTAYYGSTPKVITNYTASPANGTALTTENTKVTISFSTAEPVEQTIHVYELSGIVATNPTKMTYNAGDAFDPEGMEVTATWGGEASDAIHETVTPTSITPATLTNDTEADKVVTVTITYSHESVEKSTTVNVTVHPLPSVLMTWSVAGATDVIPQNNAYSNGADKYILKLPTTSPDPVAAGFTSDFVFKGWTKATSVNKSGDDITYAAANDLEDGATTFYAVFAHAEPVLNEVFNETFAGCAGTGGNDDTWSGNIGTSNIVTDNSGWTTANSGGASACIKSGTGSKQGSATTPTITMNGNGKLTFKAAAFGTDETTINLSTVGATLGTSSVSPTAAAWEDFEVNITNASGSVQITFEASANNNQRFFLDEVVVSKTSTAYSNYRLAPSSVKAPTGLTAGTYYCESKTITLAQEDGKDIYYTLDGTTPSTTNGTKYTSPFSINANCTIKAVAYDGDEEDYSIVAEAAYVIVTSIDAPTMPASGKFYGASKEVAITHALAGIGDFAIHYSYDDASYDDYSAALNITATQTVYAYATIGELTSDKVSATYTKGEAVTYKKVTSAAELVPGMKFIIVSNKDDAYYATKSGALGSSSNAVFFNAQSIEAPNTENEITIGDEPVSVFVLGGAPSEWTLTAEEGQLYCNAAKKVNYSSNGVGTWDIIFNEGVPTIASTNTDFEAIRFNYNNGEPRFTTYTSSMADVAIYMRKPGYERTVREGYYGTICLPNGGKMIGTTLYEIAYYDAGEEKIFFDEVLDGNMVAGMPYIFQPVEGAQKLYQYSNASHADSPVPAADANGLVGNLGSTITLSAGDYFLYNNQYYVVSASETRTISVPQYYAYIDMSEVSHQPTSPQPNRRRIAMSVHGEQVATGMDELNASEAPVKVMIDGKFYILRGEKMYDATGKLVK